MVTPAQSVTIPSADTRSDRGTPFETSAHGLTGVHTIVDESSSLKASPDLLRFSVIRRLLGDRPPVRDVGLLAAAAARPQASAFDVDAYLDIWAKAAAFLQSVVNGHALIDGNKRLGWLAKAVFLELN